VFPVRCELNIYTLYRRKSVFKGLNNIYNVAVVGLGPSVPAPDYRREWSTDGMIIGRGKPQLFEDPSQCHSVHHKSHMDYPRTEPGL
jgi:hypothetical protein